MPDWKKEVKLADLFKRDKAERLAAEAPARAREASQQSVSGDASEPDRPSFFKRELKLSALLRRHSKPVPAQTPTPEPSAVQARAAAPSDPSSATGAPTAADPVPSAPAPTVDAPASGPVATQADAVLPGQQTPAEPQGQPGEFPAPESHQSETPSTAPAGPASAGDEAGNWQGEVSASELMEKMGWAEGGPPEPPANKASEKRTPRPDSPRLDSSGDGSDDGSVWKRELKAGDLFRRREKAPAVPGDAFSQSAAEPVSFWKKEISLTDLLRKPGLEGEESGASAPADASEQEATPKEGKKGRAFSLPKLGGSPFGKRRSSRRSASDTPLAVPLTRAVNLLPPDLALQKKRAFGPREIGVGVAAVAVIAELFILVTGASSNVSDAETTLEAPEAQQAALVESAAELTDAAGIDVVASPLGLVSRCAAARCGAVRCAGLWSCPDLGSRSSPRRRCDRAAPAT